MIKRFEVFEEWNKIGVERYRVVKKINGRWFSLWSRYHSSTPALIEQNHATENKSCWCPAKGFKFYLTLRIHMFFYDLGEKLTPRRVKEFVL